tara:strand:+ start:1793 stop:2710 length:918 start_codon:yes stop_codon:yes gene_type:complete
MASNKGLILGVGILGISAIALMNMDTSTTSSLPQAGGVSGTSPYTNGDNFTDSDDDDYQMNKSSSECSMAWDSNGNRINNTWVYHGELYMKFDRFSCDLNGARAKVYTDKRVYIAGEPIKILAFKSYWENRGHGDDEEWHPWFNDKKEYGERMSFLMGLESTDGNLLLNFGNHNGTKKSKDGSYLKNGQWDGDLKNDGLPYAEENRGITVKSVTTSEGDIGEYELTFAVELGPYNTGSPCGASNCLDPSVNDDDCNNRKTTSQKLITVLPRDCKNESSAESYKSEESKNILRAEHFIQSYQQNWV